MDSLIITRGGKELVSRLIEGSTTVKFTKIRTSDHDYSAISDLTGISELESIKQEVPISKITRVDDTTVVVRALMNNKDLSEGYYVRTAGLYAKDGEENEILFGISVADEADHMPAYGNSRPSGIIFTMNVLVDNAKQVVLNIDPTGAATIQDIMDIETPEFDDSGTVEGISSFPSFLETMKSKMNFFQFFRNLKAGLQFVLHTGQIVNSCVSDRADLPLSAAQGKALKDLYTQLYSELDSKIYGIPNKNIADLLDLSAPDGLYRVDPAAKNNPVGTYGICEVRSTDDGKGWRFVTFYATSPANIVRRNFYNSYGTTNPGWSGWLADGLPIDFTDINIELSPEQWTTSNNGLKYYNHTGWNIPSNALGVCANIMNWHGTPGNVTCSVYDNSYLQLRCEDAISWGGTIRVFYINSCLM